VSTKASTVAIVGAGLIGRAWATIFARAGWHVRLTDPHAPTLAAAPDLVHQELRSLASHGLAEDPAGAARRVKASASLEEALRDVDYVQENGPETLEAKRAIFADLDRLTPRNAVIASSSSAIVSSLFTETLATRERCLIAHPVNPPHLVPLVELCGAPWTSADTIERARQVYLDIGQVPINVNREIEGFILNRLQAVLLSEAFRLVQSGHVTPQDLDKTLKDGLGLRWSFMGPFETIELNAPAGIPDYCARYGPSLARLSAADPAIYAGEKLARLVKLWGRAPGPDEVAARMRWRDARLAALKAHKRAQ
jgi:3-hydroxyacyl-CoA dehydrogenase